MEAWFAVLKRREAGSGQRGERHRSDEPDERVMTEMSEPTSLGRLKYSSCAKNKTTEPQNSAAPGQKFGGKTKRAMSGGEW
jgi:hypothetical protein